MPSLPRILKSKGRFQVFRSRVAGALRVSAYLMLVCIALSYWFIRSAYAGAEKTMQQLGERLARELGPSIVGPPQALRINGQTLLLASEQTDLSVEQVLDRVEASCAPGSPDQPTKFAMFPELEQVKGPLPPRLEKLLHEDPTRFGVVRSQIEGEGHLACLAQPKGRRGLRALVDAVKAFGESGNVSDLGEARYVRARKLPNGKTHVITVWPEGEFRLGSMFPENGDAPGSDMAGVPRPPDARRDLCATSSLHGYGLRLYDSPKPAAELVRFYEREMPKLGWDAVALPLEGGKLRSNVSVRAYTRRGAAVAIAVETAPKGNPMVSLIDFGAVRRSTAVR